MAHILCLDIDGVLHPADCKVLLDFNAPGWQLAMQARTQGLLRWSNDLGRCLQGTQVQVLVHSTWRRRASDRVLQELLGSDLGHRVIIAQVSPEERVSLSHAAYIDSALRALECMGLHADSVCILDDRPALFEEDCALLEAWSPLHIWTDGALGLSDARIQAQLSQWARCPA